MSIKTGTYSVFIVTFPATSAASQHCKLKSTMICLVAEDVREKITVEGNAQVDAGSRVLQTGIIYGEVVQRGVAWK